nr:hypothetical protein Itr_chr07CG05410 [Ipomoea trifida]
MADGLAPPWTPLKQSTMDFLRDPDVGSCWQTQSSNESKSCAKSRMFLSRSSGNAIFFVFVTMIEAFIMGTYLSFWNKGTELEVERHLVSIEVDENLTKFLLVFTFRLGSDLKLREKLLERAMVPDFSISIALEVRSSRTCLVYTAEVLDAIIALDGFANEVQCLGIKCFHFGLLHLCLELGDLGF